MSNEDLMKVRYKVIATWPKMDYMVGDIITIFNEAGHLGSKTEDGGWLEYESFYKDYPHLFQKLEWWMERRAEEMPMYMRRVRMQGNSDTGIEIGQIINVKKWGYDFFNEVEYPEIKILAFYTDRGINFDENCFEPVKEADFINFKTNGGKDNG